MDGIDFSKVQPSRFIQEFHLKQMSMCTITEKDSMAASVRGSMMSSVNNFGLRESKDSVPVVAILAV